MCIIGTTFNPPLMDKISTLILMASLIIIMLGMGLSLVINDFKRIIVYPKAIVVGLVNQMILLPLIGFAIVVAFPLRFLSSSSFPSPSACLSGAIGRVSHFVWPNL